MFPSSPGKSVHAEGMTRAIRTRERAKRLGLLTRFVFLAGLTTFDGVADVLQYSGPPDCLLSKAGCTFEARVALMELSEDVGLTLQRYNYLVLSEHDEVIND